MNSTESILFDSGTPVITCEYVVSPIELKEGGILIRDDDNGGIYFVETGLMRVTPAVGFSSTLNSRQVVVDPSLLSIGHMDARLRRSLVDKEQTFRLARVGQGWVIGGIEATSADGLHFTTNPGVSMVGYRLSTTPPSPLPSHSRNGTNEPDPLYASV